MALNSTGELHGELSKQTTPSTANKISQRFGCPAAQIELLSWTDPRCPTQCVKALQPLHGVFTNMFLKQQFFTNSVGFGISTVDRKTQCEVYNRFIYSRTNNVKLSKVTHLVSQLQERGSHLQVYIGAADG